MCAAAAVAHARVLPAITRGTAVVWRLRFMRRRPFVTIVSVFAVGCGAKLGDDAPPSDAGDAEVSVANGCPTSGQPTVGAPCAPEGLTCDYSACRAPEWRGGPVFFCSKGVWMPGGASCNPPPPWPPCPATEPSVGAPCTRPADAPACSFADECPANPTDHGTNDYVCTSAEWMLVSPKYVAPCPIVPPSDGESCACAAHSPSGGCDYGMCLGFTCDATTQRWKRKDVACDPAPDAGG
jgi:hypothetical protein